MNKMYFEIPTQVAFWEEDHYIGGIAYRDEIICGCCGGVISIEDVYTFAQEGVVPVVEYQNWEAINSYIIADKESHFRLEDPEDEED